jgi:polysaccharide biosynthesis protein PelC
LTVGVKAVDRKGKSGYALKSISQNWIVNYLFYEEIMMAKRAHRTHFSIGFFPLIFFFLVACASQYRVAENYHDPDVDFALLRTIAVMPFSNLTNDKLAGERVRNTFMNSLLSTGALYVIPAGEIARGISRAGIDNPWTPSGEEVSKLAAIVGADAVITGVVKEYGEVRSGAITANVISVSMQMIEKESRKVIWSASTTKGGISTWDRLFGAGGEPMEDVTQAAVDDIIKKLFY